MAAPYLLTTEVWSFLPGGTMEMALVPAQVRQVQGVVGVPLVGAAAPDAVVRQYTTRYPLVTSADAFAMARFFTRHQGAAYPFQWVNPHDGVSVQVRFDPQIELTMFQPEYLSVGDVVFTAVAS